jgi:hypothetical protein
MSSRQRTSTHIGDWNSITASWCNLLTSDHPTPAGYIVFLKNHMQHSQDQIWGHKTHISIFKRMKSIQNVLSDHRRIALDINNRKKKKTKVLED